MPHAVSRLRAERLARSAKPFRARGGLHGERCAGCRLVLSHCLCALRPRVATRAGVCLIMADIEPLKPSNTGWLIADVVADTSAFGWTRTAADPALLALLADPQWQPYVVFPGEFVAQDRVIAGLLPPAASQAGQTNKRPLFILLDATWPEARKMFRKSPYLNHLPVLSLQPGQLSRYKLRRSRREDHLCTSEVAALCLELAGETLAAKTLEVYLDVFTHHYLQARQQQPVDGEGAAHVRLRGMRDSPPAGEERRCRQNKPMNTLSTFPITRKWPAQHPERLQLYSLPTPNGVKVSIMLEETGLAYEPHLVSFETNDQMTPEFLSLNPNNKIPAILDPNGPGGKPLALFESGAILLYLAEKTGQFILKDAAGRYETIQWLMFQMGGIGPMFGQLGFFHKFAGKDYEDKRPRDRYVAESKRLLGVLNQWLASRDWLMGDAYTIADIATFPWVRNLVGFYGAGDLVGIDAFPHVQRALAAFVARPAVVRGLAIPARN